MLIALDYDDTYTQDPELWNEFIKNSKQKDHEVICVTMRHDIDFERTEVVDSIGKLCNIIFTGRKSKKLFLNMMGIIPDVWIDDKPFYIYEDGY